MVVVLKASSLNVIKITITESGRQHLTPFASLDYSTGPSNSVIRGAAQ